VWRRELPGSAEPPVWISLRLNPEPTDDALPEQFTLVTFRAGDGYELTEPELYRMADADVAALVGVPVSRDRGDGYQPREPEPTWMPDWRVAWTILLPPPRNMNRGCFTTVPSWWRRLARQVFPRRAPRDCCRYHRVDWHQVSAAAIRVTRQARREGLDGWALADRAVELAEEQGLPPREKEELALLFTAEKTMRPPRYLQRNRHYAWGNGRHRITAMLDSGVRRAVIERPRWQKPPAHHVAREGR